MQVDETHGGVAPEARDCVLVEVGVEESRREAERDVDRHQAQQTPVHQQHPAGIARISYRRIDR